MSNITKYIAAKITAGAFVSCTIGAVSRAVCHSLALDILSKNRETHSDLTPVQQVELQALYLAPIVAMAGSMVMLEQRVWFAIDDIVGFDARKHEAK